MHQTSLFAFVTPLLLAAGASASTYAMPPGAGAAHAATAMLAPASGSRVGGRVELMPMAGGVHLTGVVTGLASGGRFGFHVHEKGDCSAVDASSAGGHFNPAGQRHGRAGQGPHHAGDMDNLVADGDGRARIEVMLAGASLGDGAASDIFGRALVVHAGTDDYVSQPAGDSGGRVACGVINAGAGPDAARQEGEAKA